MGFLNYCSKKKKSSTAKKLNVVATKQVAAPPSKSTEISHHIAPPSIPEVALSAVVRDTTETDDAAAASPGVAPNASQSTEEPRHSENALSTPPPVRKETRGRKKKKVVVVPSVDASAAPPPLDVKRSLLLVKAPSSQQSLPAADQRSSPSPEAHALLGETEITSEALAGPPHTVSPSSSTCATPAMEAPTVAGYSWSYISCAAPKEALFPYQLENKSRGVFFLHDSSCMQWIPSGTLHSTALPGCSSSFPADGLLAVENAAPILMYVNPDGHSFLFSTDTNSSCDPASATRSSDLAFLVPSLLHSKLHALCDLWPLDSLASTATPSLLWNRCSNVSNPSCLPSISLSRQRWARVTTADLTHYFVSAGELITTTAGSPQRWSSVYSASLPTLAASRGFLIPYVCGVEPPPLSSDVETVRNGQIVLGNRVVPYPHHCFSPHSLEEEHPYMTPPSGTR